jgi:hypothetical protein
MKLFTHTLKNQILSLVFDINTNTEPMRTKSVNEFLFTHIFTIFTNLRYLNFCPSSIGYQALSFDTSPSTVISSILLELHIYLKSFVDCLYLLDGCFNNLRILSVKIYHIHSRDPTINNKVNLINI